MIPTQSASTLGAKAKTKQGMPTKAKEEPSSTGNGLIGKDLHVEEQKSPPEDPASEGKKPSPAQGSPILKVHEQHESLKTEEEIDIPPERVKSGVSVAVSTTSVSAAKSASAHTSNHAGHYDHKVESLLCKLLQQTFDFRSKDCVPVVSCSTCRRIDGSNAVAHGTKNFMHCKFSAVQNAKFKGCFID